MGLCLIAAFSFSWSMVVGILTAAAGLGFVIFVHELGHFAVARMCGVKCEKFMVGFDFWGLKLSRKWGETEYGIGVFPLGGYVKMFGQDDDPSKTVEQIEASQVEAGSEFAVERRGPDGKTRWVDRRSYQSKSVPQRMAIISAGVVMNIIFAFVFAVIAFGLGVDYMPCVVSHTSPGAPAWRAGLEPGDEIIQIGERSAPGFDHLSSGVSLGDMQNGVQFRVRRAASGEEEDLVLKPETLDGLAKIGVSPPIDNRITKYADKLEAIAKARSQPLPPVKPDDLIVSVNGASVGSYRDLMAQLAAYASEPIEMVVRRGSKDGGSAAPEEVSVTIAPLPAKRLGLVMTMGPIVAVQKGSPAEQAGLQPGDTILGIDGVAIGAGESGEPSLDPANLDEVLARSQEPVELMVQRASAEAAPETIVVEPRPVTWIEFASSSQAPMPLTSLGAAYRIEPVVMAVVDGSPAAAAGIQPGDVITAAVITPPAADASTEPKPGNKIEIAADKRHWPSVLYEIARLPVEAEVALTIARGDQTTEAKMSPAVSPDAYLADRGLIDLLAPILRERKVESFSEQLAYASDRTWFSLTTVVRFLQKLFEKQVPVDKLGGPLTILQTSYLVASVSLPAFLLFLTLLSANLAVLNFLPIPVLDGGHMVFLAWEGLTGKPASEKLTVALHLIGMVLLLGLMIFVTRNDIIRIFYGQ